MQRSLTFEEIKSAVAGNVAAIRRITRLEPAAGAGDKVFPPTYSGGVYVTEVRRIGENPMVPCVVLDSVQSQANRFEEALLQAYDDGKLALPLLISDFSDDFPDIGRITALDVPHRIADAIFKESLLDGRPFRESTEGRAFRAAVVRNATGLFGLCPTALVFGVWDSTGAEGGLGNKFARAVTSEVVGIDVVPGKRTGGRLDPLPIKDLPLYYDETGGWTPDEGKAKRDEDGKPLRYRPKNRGEGKPSELNLGNVTPDVARARETASAPGGKLIVKRDDELPGGVTISYAVQTTVLHLGALRRLRFPDTKGKFVRQRDQAARAVLAALALAGIVHQQEQGYFLRSRCHLIPTDDSPFETVTTGARKTEFHLTTHEADTIFAEAVKEAKGAGLPWREEPLVLKPKQALVELVRRSRQTDVVEGTP